MIDYKFHIFSLVAIFLALGIGIVVGITLVGEDSLVQEQKIIIDRLEEEFKALREESRATKQEIATFKSSNALHQQFAQTVLPILVKDRLQGQNIAVINTNYYVSSDYLEDILKLAGAKVVSVTKINNEFDFSAENLRYVLSNLNIEPAKNVNKMMMLLAEYIGQGILTGFEPEKLKFLQEIDLLQFTGSATVPLNSAVLLGGKYVKNDNLVKFFDLSLIDLFSTKGVKVAATEQSDVPYSSIPLYKTKDITTIDNIETAIGQVALIYALNGKAGHYGIKETANSILPNLNEAEDSDI